MKIKQPKEPKEKRGRKPGTKNKVRKPANYLQETLYTIDQAAEILQMSSRTVRNMIKHAELMAAQTRAGIRIKGAWIDESLNQMIISKGKNKEQI